MQSTSQYNTLRSLKAQIRMIECGLRGQFDQMIREAGAKEIQDPGTDDVGEPRNRIVRALSQARNDSISSVLHMLTVMNDWTPETD